MADSNASTAVDVWGNGNITAACAAAVGGVTNHGGLVDTVCTAPETNQIAAPDPYSNVPEPSTTGACASTNGSNWSPGIYCSGMDIHGNVTLAPGTYVLEGNFKLNNNATISGAGVTIFLAGNSTLNINGGATMNLSAPTSGTYSGMLFFGDRAGTGAQTMNGTASSVITGVVYFPNESVSYLGNFSGANGCTQIVADTVSYSGNTQFGINCAAYGMKPVPAVQTVKLVG
jgi:hypothetical protein